MSSSRPHHRGYFRPNAREVLSSPALNPGDLGKSAHQPPARELTRYPDMQRALQLAADPAIPKTG
jgi:hypothetical protein